MNFYITVASLTGLLTLREPNAIKAMGYGVFVSAADEHIHSGPVRMVLSIAVLLCVMFTIITLTLFALGLYNAALNVTQVESKYKGPNPYVLPTAWENMKQLFGSWSIWLFFPVLTTGSDSVGTTFPYKKIKVHAPGGYGSVDTITVSAAIP